MAVGTQVNKSVIDNRAGNIALQLKAVMDQVRDFDDYLDAIPNADLVAMGYTDAEVATLKSALNDLDQLRTIWEGGAALLTPKDFRAFQKQLWGLGI